MRVLSGLISFQTAFLIYSFHKSILLETSAIFFGFGGDDGGRESNYSGKKCPYEVLGVPKDSSHKDIRKAFIGLSKKFHPDVNDAPDASDRFKEINEAYEILSNNDKRDAYDKYGFEGLERLNQGGDVYDEDFGFDDIFSNFFGGFGFGDRETSSRAEPINLQVPVTLYDLYHGKHFEIKLKVTKLCENYSECEIHRPDCHGYQVKVMIQQRGPGMYIQQQMRDPTCIGLHKGWKEDCKVCPNGPTYEEEVELDFSIEPGTRHGQKIVMEGRGNMKPNKKRGNVVLHIHMSPDDVYKREGDDLYRKLDISLKESLLGFNKPIDLFKKKTINVAQSGVTPHNHTIKISGEGMPIPNSHHSGNLYVTINVQFPKRLTEKQIKLIQEAFP